MGVGAVGAPVAAVPPRSLDKGVYQGTSPIVFM